MSIPAGLGARFLVAIHMVAYVVPFLLVLYSTPMPLEIVAASVILGATLIALSIIDLKSFRLPDTLTLPLVVVGLCLAYGLGWQNPALHVLAAMVGFLSFYAIARLYLWVREAPGLGLGDAKLLAGAGAWVGLHGLLSVIVIAVMIMLAALGLTSVFGKLPSRTTPLPFGPALAFGLWLVWLYGPIL